MMNVFVNGGRNYRTDIGMDTKVRRPKNKRKKINGNAKKNEEEKNKPF